MYLLDTNVVSEMRLLPKNKAHPNVVRWMRQFDDIQSFFISSMTILELERGALLKRRKDPVQGEILCDWIENQVIANFESRILPISLAVVRQCAKLHIPNPRPEFDALIAATSMQYNLALVTRNIKDFEGLPIRLINPFDGGF